MKKVNLFARIFKLFNNKKIMEKMINVDKTRKHYVIP